MRRTLALITSATLTVGCTSGEQSTPIPETSTTKSELTANTTSNTTEPMPTTTLREIDCKYNADNPQPLDAELGVIVLLGCFKSSNPNADAGVYSGPDMYGFDVDPDSEQVTRVADGVRVIVTCQTSGAWKQDSFGALGYNTGQADPHESNQWLSIETDDGEEGFMPATVLGFPNDDRIPEC